MDRPSVTFRNVVRFSSLFGPFFLNFSGLANPLLWMSWFLFRARRYPAAFWPATVASLFAAETFQLIWQPYYFDEAGAVRGFFHRPMPGWYCWVASMLVIMLASRRLRRSEDLSIDLDKAGRNR